MTTRAPKSERKLSPQVPQGRPIAICFDLDGTLVDSLGDLSTSVNALLARLGRPPLPQARIGQAVGQGVRALLERCIAATGPELSPRQFEQALADFGSIYLEACDRNTPPLPGALEALHGLAQRGIRLAVVTNKPQAPTERILESLGILRPGLIEIALGGDTPFGRKPAPGQVIEIARRLGCPLPTSDLWLVGDSRNDLDAALAAGITPVGVRGGYDQGESMDSLAARAWRILDRLDELLPLVDRLAGSGR